MCPDPERQFWSPYIGMGNNWINGIDMDGERVVPINTVLNSYGYSNRGVILFPESSTALKLAKGFSTVYNFLTPANKNILPSIISVANDINGYNSGRFNDINDANRLNVQEYHDALKTIEADLLNKIDDVNSRISELEKSMVKDFHRAQIASLTRFRWDLIDNLVPVQSELITVGEIVASPYCQE